jgi:hypothetical protein
MVATTALKLQGDPTLSHFGSVCRLRSVQMETVLNATNISSEDKGNKTMPMPIFSKQYAEDQANNPGAGRPLLRGGSLAFLIMWLRTRFDDIIVSSERIQI